MDDEAASTENPPENDSTKSTNISETELSQTSAKEHLSNEEVRETKEDEGDTGGHADDAEAEDKLVDEAETKSKEQVETAKEEGEQEENPNKIRPIGDDYDEPREESFGLHLSDDEEVDEEPLEEESEYSFSPPIIDLNATLDKDRLQTAFEEVFRYKKHAESRKSLLNRKVSEYYRRQQNYGVFNQESATVHKDYIQRYRMLLLDMDARLATKKQFEIDSKNRIEPLKQAIEQTKDQYHGYCESFAKLFYDIAITLQGGATGKELKETTVLNIIKRMQNVRNIINVERLEFIKTENSVAEIEVKAKSLEDLGNGLRMVDFEQLRSETQSLSDKIEERNNELEKLRLRCNSDTQILAHVREKDFMLHNIIYQQSEILKETSADVEAARERCNQLKMQRDMYRRKHSELSVECGLLDKPPLLRDFDLTVAAIEQKKGEIAQLQLQNENIEKEVRKIAIILSEGELIKTGAQKFEESLLNEISFMDAPIFPRIKKI